MSKERLYTNDLSLTMFTKLFLATMAFLQTSVNSSSPNKLPNFSDSSTWEQLVSYRHLTGNLRTYISAKVCELDILVFQEISVQGRMDHRDHYSGWAPCTHWAWRSWCSWMCMLSTCKAPNWSISSVSILTQFTANIGTLELHPGVHNCDLGRHQVLQVAWLLLLEVLKKDFPPLCSYIFRFRQRSVKYNLSFNVKLKIRLPRNATVIPF